MRRVVWTMARARDLRVIRGARLAYNLNSRRRSRGLCRRRTPRIREIMAHEEGRDSTRVDDREPARRPDDDAVRLPGEAEGLAERIENATEVQYHLFVERVKDYAIFLTDAHGIITHWGEGAERMKEFPPEEVVGRHLRMLYPEGGAEDGTADEHIRYAIEHGEYVGEGTRRAGIRGTFPARVTLTALRQNGRLVGFSKVTRDLTDQRRLEARMREALRAAEAGNEEKARFLATMSHEIRTPINAILGYAELLDLGIAGELAEGQRGYLERVRTSGRHLLALIEDVLDFARVEAGRLTVEPAMGRVAGVAGASLDLLRPQAEAGGVAVEIDCADGEFWGDETRVRQILVNLIGNATKFTPAGGTIRVTCGHAAPPAAVALAGPGPWTFIRVRDTGIGIPAERLGSVFEPFVQIDNALTRTHAGTGLGLAISRRLARLMGGDLTVESRLGEGSVFTLWLPASPDAAPAPIHTDEPDDSPSLTRAGHYLADSSHDVVGAFVRRLRVEPATPGARDRTRSELEDHVATMLTDMAQTLVVLEEDGPDAEAIARDGSDVQHLLAERHGLQRRRLHWPETGLVREYEILHEEVERVLRHSGAGLAGHAVEEALLILQRLLDRARDISLRAFRSAE